MTEDTQRKTEKEIKTKIKTIRMPTELASKIEKDAERQNRDFTKQVLFIIKKYYNLLEQ